MNGSDFCCCCCIFFSSFLHHINIWKPCSIVSAYEIYSHFVIVFPNWRLQPLFSPSCFLVLISIHLSLPYDSPYELYAVFRIIILKTLILIMSLFWLKKSFKYFPVTAETYSKFLILNYMSHCKLAFLDSSSSTIPHILIIFML